jgi:predicted patatin/cPLA2 family phospholipase
MLKVIQSKYKKYPAFIKTMASRADCYNETLDMIKTMEDNNEIFVIRPTEPIHLGTIERNADNLQNVHDLGVKVCKERLEALKEYLNDH